MVIKSPSQVSEDKTTAASYIISFYREVEELSHYYALYLNFILELEGKLGSQFEKTELGEADKNIYKEALHNMRYYTIKAYNRYRCLVETKRIKESKTLEKIYPEIEKNYAITRPQIKIIVIKFNVILADEVMKSLLETSQAIVENIYDNK